MSTAELVAPVVESRAPVTGVGRVLLRSPLAVCALAWLSLVLVGSLAAPVLAPYAATSTDLGHTLEGPSAAHLLGTDQLGRDVLSRLMFGGNGALLGAVEATAIYVVIGVALGVLAGYYERRLDPLISRWVEITVALPGVLILLVVLAVFPHNQHAAMLAFGILASPGLVRVLRAETLRVKNELYVSAARVAGCSDWQILRRHIVTRLVTTIIVQAALLASVAIVVLAGLAFLGLGPQDPAPSWGGMVNVAGQVLDRDSWLLVPTGGVIALSVMALGLIGDALRDATAAQWERSGSAARPQKAAPPKREPLRAASDAAGTSLLSVRSLTVRFDTEGLDTTVVQGVSFDVAPREILAIVGESGCGKSVTAGAILGLLPENATVDAQSCTFGGVELLDLNETERHALRGRRLAYISQEPMSALDPTFRVGALLAEAVRRHRRLPRAGARAAALELLELVNLPNPEEVARRYPHQISGGMAQRVAIALALAGEPELIVADEPTSALDVTVQAEIIALLRRLQAEMGLSIVLITHDWGVVAQLCRRALVMYAGEIVEAGSVRRLYHDAAHPYTAGLLAANPQRALALATTDARLPQLPAIPGTVPPPQEWPLGCHFQARCRFVAADCRAEPVPLVELGDGHVSRCRHIGELRRSEAAS